MAITIQACEKKKTAAFCRLVEGVRAIVAREPDAGQIGQRVAALLQPFLGNNDFLPCEELSTATADYCQHILHVEADGSFSVVALVWLPGQETAVHDHVSWCVVGVHKGAEYETVYEVCRQNGNSHLRVATEQVNACGTVATCIPPGDIHRVANSGDDVAVSVHIYGADIGALGSSIRRRYELAVSAA